MYECLCMYIGSVKRTNERSDSFNQSERYVNWPIDFYFLISDDGKQQHGNRIPFAHSNITARKTTEQSYRDQATSVEPSSSSSNHSTDAHMKRTCKTWSSVHQQSVFAIAWSTLSYRHISDRSLRFYRHSPTLLYRREHRPPASSECIADRWSSWPDRRCTGRYYRLIGCIDRLARQITCCHIEDLKRGHEHLYSLAMRVLKNWKRIVSLNDV